jgi:cell division transport system permease protein
MARRVDYYFKETLQGLRRNGLVAFAAVSTAFIALFLFGGALLVSREVNLLIDTSTHDVEVSVFLRDCPSGSSPDCVAISPDQQTHLQDILTSMPQVAVVTYESKEAAYQNFLTQFHDQASLVQNVSPDALPASFQVKLKDPSQYAVVSARIQNEPGIEKIVDNREILRRLFAIVRLFRVGVLAVAIVMIVSASALIGNTVRLAVFNRRREIGIMKLVGATNWHIRMPFLIEGVIEGLLGAGAAILGLFVLKVLFIDPLRGNLGFFPLVGTRDIVFTVVPILVIGAVVAVVAGLFAMRRFLEV